jgi:predicted Zn-dependent protease
LSTVFVMITSEASYARVAEAAESALDSYLLKPHTASALGERLWQARRRKRILKSIFEAIDEGRYEEAAQLCLARFNERGDYWLFAARIGAELLLHAGRHAEAKELYDAVLTTQALPWARLGIARAQIDGNETNKATRTLESLISDNPTYVDAYDVMGRVHVDQGNLDEALGVFKQAASLTPGSIGRLQKLGMLAFYTGDHDESARALDRAVTVGISSKMFDYQTLVLLAFARFKQKETKGLQRCVDNLAHALSKAPQSRRLQRFAQVVDVLSLMLHKQVGDAVKAIRDLAKDTRAESFDIEAACNMLALLAHLTAAELRLDGVEDWVDAIGYRHCTSKALTELLIRTANVHPPFAERIRMCQQTVATASEQAMAFSLAGDPGQAVKLLLECGRSTLNGKVIDTARAVLQRHHQRIADAESLAATAEDLRSRFAATPGKVPLGESGRKPGSLALRVSANGEETPGDDAAPVSDAAAPAAA